jgi:hypothetical protein
LDGTREKKKCFSCCLWRCLTLKAKISASSNVTGRACDFTTYSLFMSHANGPERDRVKYWDSRRNRTPSPVFSCYESLESTTVHTTACQWIKSRASRTHFQPSTNFSSVHPSVQQRRLLFLPINCLIRCYSTKILYVFLTSPPNSCPNVVLMRTNEPLRTSEWDRFITSGTVRRLGKKFWLFVVADVQYIFLDIQTKINITVAPSNNKAQRRRIFDYFPLRKNDEVLHRDKECKAIIPARTHLVLSEWIFI